MCIRDRSSRVGIPSVSSSRCAGVVHQLGQVGETDIPNTFQMCIRDRRNAALSTLFGADAVRVASIAYAGGADAALKWQKDVSETGYAAQQAARLTDNLRGDLERLGGSIDTALIKSCLLYTSRCV